MNETLSKITRALIAEFPDLTVAQVRELAQVALDAVKDKASKS